ncbi:MAG: cytochrome b/b6 domain-containing protein [Tolumonas sp.]|nr:cytochrome b/b6 domain-containing protein [Tolumonas sp.]
MNTKIEQVKVWDLFVRVFHWTIVTLFFCNYFLSERGLPFERGSIVHIYTGYVIIGFVLARLIWGIIGSKNARFSSFIPKPSEFIHYMKCLMKGKHNHYEGHNPAGAVMIVCLLSGLLITGLSGWLASLGDVFDGWQATVAAATDFVPWGDVHAFFANLTLLGAGIHIIAVMLVSHLTKENLVLPMLSGYKKKPK